MSEQDFSMAFVDTADRLTALMVHGFPFNSAIWQLQKEDLINFARMIAPDLRGHGQSDNITGPYTMKLLADDCMDLMGHLGVAAPFVVGGLSMGGYITFEAYRRYKELIGGLVLTSTRAGADSEAGKANRNKAIESIQANGVEPFVDEMLPKLFAPQNYEEQEDIVDFVREVMLETSVEGMVGALAAMRDRPDSTATLSQIDVPTLIIHGADDQIVPVFEAEAMHKAIPHSRLVILQDAGHLPNLEQPDAFNDALIDFLEEVEEVISGEEA